MTRFPYFPLFMMNFLADTAHLTKAQKWDYLTLLWDMWLHGGWIADNDREIARKLKLTMRQWRAFRPLIQPLLISKDQKLSQKKLLCELSRAENIQKKNNLRTQKATLAKLNKTNDMSSTLRPSLRSSLRSPTKESENISSMVAPSFRETLGNGSAAMASSPATRGRSSATPSNDPNPATDALPDFGSFAKAALPDRLAQKLAELGAETVPAYLTQKTLKH